MKDDLRFLVPYRGSLKDEALKKLLMLLAGSRKGEDALQKALDKFLRELQGEQQYNIEKLDDTRLSRVIRHSIQVWKPVPLNNEGDYKFKQLSMESGLSIYLDGHADDGVIIMYRPHIKLAYANGKTSRNVQNVKTIGQRLYRLLEGKEALDAIQKYTGTAADSPAGGTSTSSPGTASTASPPSASWMSMSSTPGSETLVLGSPREELEEQMRAKVANLAATAGGQGYETPARKSSILPEGLPEAPQTEEQEDEELRSLARKTQEDILQMEKAKALLQQEQTLEEKLDQGQELIERSELQAREASSAIFLRTYLDGYSNAMTWRYRRRSSIGAR